MRVDAPYLVKRSAPPVGRPDEPRRISVESQHYRLDEAIEDARACLIASRTPGTWRDAGYGLGQCVFWIERRGAPATVRAARRRSRPSQPPRQVERAADAQAVQE
jgi:hypothetical protein